MTETPPGWYNDGSGKERWWDGTGWTDQFKPAEAPQPQTPQAAYGQPVGHQAAYQPAGPVLPKHPQTTTVLILGILSLIVCGVLGPFAWVIGGRALKEIDASPDTWDGRNEINIGRILGIVATILWLVVIGIFVLMALWGLLFSAAVLSEMSQYVEIE